MVAISAVAIAHCEEVAMRKTHDVRISQVSILVLLVRVIRCNATLRGERKLRYHVRNLL